LERIDAAKQQEVEQSTETMLEAINMGSQPFTGDIYNILRVVVAHPLDANFNSPSSISKTTPSNVNLPFARLVPEVFTAELATCDHGKALVERFTGGLKRARESFEEGEEGEEGEAGPSTKRREVSGA
jgi:hypothetical protein